MSTACTPRMLSVLRELARHPGGMTTLTRGAAVTSSFQTMRSLEHRGLVRRAGKARLEIIWQLTDEGRAVAAQAGPAEPLAVLASLRQAGYGPQTPRDLQAAPCQALRAAGCTDRQIADLFGIHPVTVGQRVKHLAAMERHDIRLGTAGSVSVIIRRPDVLPGEKLTRAREIIKDLEALGAPSTPEVPGILGEAERARHVAGPGENR